MFLNNKAVEIERSLDKMQSQGELPSARPSFLLNMAAGSLLLYLLLISGSAHLETYPSLMPQLAGWTKYLDLSVGFSSLTGLNLGFTDKYWFDATLFTAAMVGLFWLYYLGYIYMRRVRLDAIWIFLSTGAFGILQLLNPYLLSRDVFAYSIIGRMLPVYGQNPLRSPIQNFPFDPNFEFLTFKQGFNNYGPVWTLFSSGIGAIATDNVAVQVLFYRLAALVFHLLNGFLIWKIAEQIHPKYQAASTLLYLWNPLLLLELGNAHNDFFLTFFILAGLWFFIKSWRWTGLVVTAFAPLSKIIVVMLVPGYIVLLARQGTGWSRRLRSLVLSGLTLGIVIALFYLPFFIGPAGAASDPSRAVAVPPATLAAMTPAPTPLPTSPLEQEQSEQPAPSAASVKDKSSLDNLLFLIGGQNQYANSYAEPAYKLSTYLLNFLTKDETTAKNLSNLLIRNILRLVFAFFLIRELWLLRDWSQLAPHLLRISLYTVFFLYTYFYAWYLVPVVALAAVTRWGIWSKTAIIFSFSAMLYYPSIASWHNSELLWKLPYYVRPFLMFGLPAAYLLWQLWREQHKQKPIK